MFGKLGQLVCLAEHLTQDELAAREPETRGLVYSRFFLLPQLAQPLPEQLRGGAVGFGPGKKKAEAEQAAASAAYLKLSDKSAAKNSDKTDAGMKKPDGTDKVNNKSEAKTVQADYEAARSVKPRKPQVKKAGKTGENEAMKKSGKSPQTQNRFKFGANKPTENKKTGKGIYSQTEERRKIK